MLFQGYFVRPTVITDISDDSPAMREEIFGPVTCVVPFDNEAEVRLRKISVHFMLISMSNIET